MRLNVQAITKLNASLAEELPSLIRESKNPEGLRPC